MDTFDVQYAMHTFSNMYIQQLTVALRTRGHFRSPLLSVIGKRSFYPTAFKCLHIVRGYMTNNNGFWIGLLDLMALLLQLLLIKVTYNSSQSRFAPFFTRLRVSSLLL
jgi:hypothetical protein